MSSDHEFQTWEVHEPFVHPKCKLGEGPSYEEDTGKLRFVDIDGNQVLWLDPHKGASSLERVDVKDPVGVTFDIEADHENILVGSKYGVAYMNRKTGVLDYLHTREQLWNRTGEEDKARLMRANDGNIDARGRFWFGMINDGKYKDPPSDDGALFCYHPDGMLRRVIDKTTIPNGIGWSKDGKTFFFTDSPTKTIFKYDFDQATGEISNKRPWFELSSEGDLPVPDGFCQDEEDCLWVALYGGWGVVRVKDVDGKAVKIGEVKLPARCTTCPRIIDKTLWITSAAEQDDQFGAESQKYGGAVFAVPIGVGPKKMHKWKKP